MKISKLHINQYRHLENLTFDFTYPADYRDASKAGKPLDKICFIGQSATGKTSLLELINSTISSFFDLRKINNDEIIDVGNFKHQHIELNFEADSILHKCSKETIEKDHKKYNFFKENYNGGGEDIINNRNNIFFLKAEILSNKNIEFFEEKTIILLEKYKDSKNQIGKYFRKNQFGDSVHESIWMSFLDDRLVYLQK